MENTISAVQQMISKISISKRYVVILLLGFSSGLPAALTASTLQAWFTEAGINLRTIGAMTFLVLPYTIRFLWSPIFDRCKIWGLDRRRGWLLATQIGLIFFITSMAFFTPTDIFEFNFYHVSCLMLLGFATSFLSASQDVVISAYQIEILPKNEQAFGASLYSIGWRIGIILSGAIALLLAKQFGWKETYLLMASLMSVGVIATLLGPDSPSAPTIPNTVFNTVVAPLKEFFQRYGIKTAIIFLFVMITYKAGDALALALNTTFLLREMHFDLATIGLVNKTVSIFSGLIGGLVGGLLMRKISLYNALMFFGLIQGVANLSYALMAYLGKSLFLLVITAFIENFCSGLGSIALLALIMALCNINYTATQFSLLVSLAFLARTFVGPVAAVMVETIGWFQFFISCFIVSLPTLILVYANKNTIKQLREDNQKQ